MVDAATLGGIGNPKWLNSADSRQVGMFIETTALAGSFTEDGVLSYQVPADKKFIITQISHIIRNPSTGVRTVKLYGATTTTGTDHYKACFAASGTGTSWNSEWISFPVHIEINTGDYIVAIPSTTDGYYGCILGVETTV